MDVVEARLSGRNYVMVPHPIRLEWARSGTQNAQTDAMGQCGFGGPSEPAMTSGRSFVGMVPNVELSAAVVSARSKSADADKQDTRFGPGY